MFVARIRADQAAQLESKNIDISTMKFKPLMDESLAKPAAAPKKANFDTSWIWLFGLRMIDSFSALIEIKDHQTNRNATIEQSNPAFWFESN